MGYDILVAVSFVVLTPVVLIGFVLFWRMNARDHEEVAGTWRRYAKRRRLAFEEPEGDWPNRSAPAIAWADGDATFRLCTVGREARVQTRLVVRPKSALLGALTIRIDGGGSGEVHVRERPLGFAPRIWNDRVRRLLLGFRQRDRVTLSYRRGRIVLTWPGGELNETRLDEARRIGAELARAMDDEFRQTRALSDPERASALVS